MDLKKLVSVGISTKNRCKDLKTCLEKTSENEELKGIQVFIIDDASDKEYPADMSSFGLNTTFISCNESKGYIVRRNELAQIMNTKYYLSFDDDSYILDGSLVKAIEYAESLDNLLCLTFPVYNPIHEEYQISSLEKVPYQTKSFIGCAHLLNIERFHSLGGYISQLVHQGEEIFLAAKGFKNNFYCYHYPDLLFAHMTSKTNRNYSRMAFYGARNKFLWNMCYLPRELLLYKQFRGLAERIQYFAIHQDLNHLSGYRSGILESSNFFSHYDYFSKHQYAAWNKLPTY